ncbi:hypothetical protein EI94DRAFT_1705814 [Lactarius quietus]|nr:hypothetical protein EI94DRAFT_1705814 [Lactarius quietus]
MASLCSLPPITPLLSSTLPLIEISHRQETIESSGLLSPDVTDLGHWLEAIEGHKVCLIQQLMFLHVHLIKLVNTLGLVGKPEKLMVMAGSDEDGKMGVGKSLATGAVGLTPTPGGGKAAGKGTVGGGGMTEKQTSHRWILCFKPLEELTNI